MLDEWYQYSMNVELLHKEKVTIIDNYYSNFPKRTAQMLKANTKFILSDKRVRTAFRNRDKEALTKVANRYYMYTNSLFANSGVVHNYILPDGTRFHRSHKPSMGSSNSYRPMVETAVESGQPVSGIEKCKNGLMFRHIQPVKEKGKIIGFLEAGVSVSFFAKRVNSIAGIKTIIMLDGKEGGETVKHMHDKPHELGSHVIIFNNTGLNFVEFIKEFNHSEKINYIKLGDKQFEVLKEFELNNYKGENIGSYLFFAERSILHGWFAKHLIVVCVIVSIGTIIVIFLIRNGFMKSISELESEHKKTLNELVIINASLEDRVKEELELSRQKDQIINQQKQVADMGQMLSAVSHHWRQPINAIGLYVQDLMEAYKSSELDEEYIKDFEKNNMGLLQQLSESIDMYRSYYQPSRETEEFLMSDVICDIGGILHSKLQAEGIELLFAANCGTMNFDYMKLEEIKQCRCEQSKVKGPKNEFKQSVLNVFFNAIDSLKEKYPEDAKGAYIKGYVGEDADELVFRITDNGIGIPADVIDDVFNPFFTTKEAGQGTGLGLYMAKTIIERHMCGMLIVKCENGETIFEMRLPKA